MFYVTILNLWSDILTYITEVNRRFRSIIQRSALAQYILELDAAGKLDVPGGLPTSDKLHLLRKHEVRRRGLQFRTIQTLGPPRQDEMHLACLMGTYGLFIHDTTRPSDNRTELRIWRPPGFLNPSPRPPSTASFDFCPKRYSFNESSDLLFLAKDLDRYESSHSTSELIDHCNSEIEIQLLTLSTHIPHPLAARPFIRYGPNSRRIERRVTDRLLGLQFEYQSGFDLVIWNWRSGDIVSVWTRNGSLFSR